jgi:hypothetical protein
MILAIKIRREKRGKIDGAWSWMIIAGKPEKK